MRTGYQLRSQRGVAGSHVAGSRSKDFEVMLAGISSRFVQAALGEMDAAIHEALAAVSEFAGVERSHVFAFDGDRETMNEIARWPALDDGGDETLMAIPRGSLPYYSAQVFAQESVFFADPSELPAWVTVDRAFLTTLGVRSAITMPLTDAGQTIGTLTLTTLSRPHTWSAEEVAMLHVAADVMAPALTRRISEREQQESINFERLITSLLSQYMNLPADALDDGLQRAIETIARFVDCDRSALFILDKSGEFAELYRGWWALGTTPIVADYVRISTTDESPYGPWIRADSPPLILSAAAIEAMRPDAAPAIRRNEIGTVANFPLVIEDQRIGWFGIGASMPRISWSAAEIRSLGLAANALANMYFRGQSERERRRHQRFEDALSDLAADFIKRPLSETRTGIVEIVDRFGRFAGSDRAAVLLIDPTDETASTYHEWIDRGEPAPIRGFPITAAPRFFDQLMAARGPWFMYVEEFPESDQLAAAALEAVGVRTLLNCPIADGEHVYGYASIGYAKSRHRPLPGTEQILAFAADIIANAMSRERLESQAVQHREALARALRLGSLGQLATGIAHELNQPLAAIVNYSRAGVRWLTGPEIDRGALAGILERVSEEAIRAGDIIHNLRNHVKGGPRPSGAASILEIIERACSLMVGMARDHRVTILTEYRGSLPFVDADPTEIEQIVINVLQNAIDSIVAADARTREVTVIARRNRSVVEVEISDTGGGFGETDPKQIFDQFYTTKPGGLGLGLSISRSLIESNGGRIEALARADGATIRLVLPIAGAKPVARHPSATRRPRESEALRRRT